jgi:hypothetical protein
LLKKYGREYFSRLRQKRDSQPTYEFNQKSPRQVAGAENGRIGGYRRAQLHGPQELSAWGRLGGQAVLKKHGNQHFRNIRAERTRKDKMVREAEGFSVETRLRAEIAEQLQRLVQLIEYVKP